MPLLGRKPLPNVKPLTDLKPGETVYTIPHTGERFRSRQEYEKRSELYRDRVWTCQCTGHLNLTHEEALNSERAVLQTIKAQFAPCYEKAVLELVHHSTLCLDTLVDQSWLKIQQCLFVDERVSLKIKTTEKIIEGIVVKVDTDGVDANPINNCSSPSSDKENSTQAGDSPKKWVPPKLLPYKYNIKVVGEDKVISHIPAADLTRVTKPPAKDLIRQFIRANSLRIVQTNPWVVDEHLVKKYQLPSKFVDFFMSPAKMAESAKRAVEATTKKRKSTSKLESAKKAKVSSKSSAKDKSSKKSKSKSLSSVKSKKSHSSPSKKSQSDSDPIEIYSESSDDEALINLMPLAVLKEGSPKKTAANGGTSSSNTPRKRGRPPKDKNESTPKKRLSLPAKLAKKEASPSKRSKTPTKNEEDNSNKRVSPRKRKKTDKSMKQMTLFDLKNQKTPTKGTPDRKKVATPPRTPWVVTRILKAKKEGQRVNFNLLTTKAAKDLTASQRARLPEEIKEVVMLKYEKLEEKRKMKKMTPAEKEAYLLKRKEEKKKILAEKMRARNVKLRKRYEDTDLELKPLPAPKLVPTPDGVPNELFGDIAQVTEFISCYNGLLMPDDEYAIQTEALVKALGSGAEGFAYMSRVLRVLLYTLLQDGIAEYYSELDTPLSDIPVTPYTASELVRLCLRRQDDEAADNDVEEESDSGLGVESEVPEDIIQFLETKELYQLTADQKLKILKGLCLRIMGTYSVQDYMEEKQKEASKLWRQKLAQMKEKNIKKKADKKTKDVEEKVEMKVEDKVDESKVTEKDLTIAHFYGKKMPGTAESTPEPESTGISDTIASADPADIDLAGLVKRRRVLAARAAAEKAEKEKEDRIRREQEAVQTRKQREQELFEKSFNDGIALAKQVLRHCPVGTDRDHNRYWVFNTASTPGLFVEKGWAGPEYDYSVRPQNRLDDEESTLSSDDEEDEETAAKNGREKMIETTFPHQCQNLWFVYDSAKDFETLVENLHPNAVRESALKAELKKRAPDIIRGLNAAKRINSDLRPSDGGEEMLAGFKKELAELELRLRNGGLGGVPNFQQWEAKLMSSTDITVLAACLNESQLFTMEKFLKGIFVVKEKKGGVKSEPVDGDVTPSKSSNVEEKDDGPQTALDRWRECIENCQTLSRLNVLMGIFDSSIKWEKSAENAKCKICRKKGEDSMSLLCDDCNQAFHVYCLRPALPYIPDGEWFCPACRPVTQRRRPKPGTYRDMNGESSSESDGGDGGGSDEEYDEEIIHDENCIVCGGDEGLVFCSECPSAFHLDCHNPPLRHTPRSNWVCVQCKTGVRIKKKRQIPVPTKKKRRSQETSSEEEESSEDEDDASDAEVLPTSQRRGGRAAMTPGMRSIGTTTTDMEKVIIPTKYKTQSKRSESRRSEPSRRAETKKETRRSDGTASKSKSDDDDPYTGYMRPTCKRGPSDLSLCEQILGCLFRHKSSWPFQSPVNKKEVPDYHTIIKKPMDFQTIKNNILCFVYSTTDQFVEDVSLVFRNAAQYNKIDSEVYTCMLDMEECFTELLRKFLPECRYEREPTLNGYGNDADPSKRPKRI